MAAIDRARSPRTDQPPPPHPGCRCAAITSASSSLARLKWTMIPSTSINVAMKGVRVLDPAGDSGMFLAVAHDALRREYDRVKRERADLRGGQVEFFDRDEIILSNHLFGVALSPESVETTKLLLWLKTARREKRLTRLDGNIKCGDSIFEKPHLSRVTFNVVIGKTIMRTANHSFI